VDCGAPAEPIGLLDESLNSLEQDDPILIADIRKRYLVEPSKLPYKWGKGKRSGMRTDGE
jgi:hypothetical protein